MSTTRRGSGPPRVTMVAARAQPEIGGIEAHVAEVARRLVAAGHDLELLTTDRSGELASVERVDGYVVRHFRAFPRSRDWYASPGLVWHLLRGRHDLVHVQGVHTLVAPLAMLACLVRGIPYLVTFHTGGSDSRLRTRARGLQFRLLAPLLRRARALVGVSQFEVERFEAVLGDRATVRLIRNGGSLPLVTGAPVPDPDLLLSVGRLEHYKGHHRMIAALPELAAARPGVRLEILGSGSAEPLLVALAERLGVADRVSVRLIPPRDRAAMAQALASAGVVALLSDYEAHPVAVMEALAVGRPVVVATTSGLAELVTLGWARGVDLGPSGEPDPRQVADAVLAQIQRPVLPAPHELPTWESCVAEVRDVYALVAGRAEVTQHA